MSPILRLLLVIAAVIAALVLVGLVVAPDAGAALALAGSLWH